MNVFDAYSSDRISQMHYVPIRILGRGAFGEAKLYRKMDDNSLVVWKELDLSRAKLKDRENADNEIEILSLLNHPNIVQYYNHYEDGDFLLIEMEYANGGNLGELLKSTETLFPEELVEWLFFQLMSAVAYVHRNAILHRDIKPLNIFLTKSSMLKLGDFGISKLLHTKHDMANSVVGTPYYMSPELMRGLEYNQKSDIWACGCVLYELLSLKKAFDATNQLRLAKEVVEGKIENVPQSYSNEVCALVKRLLHQNPEKRPEAEEVLYGSYYKTKRKLLEEKVQRVSPNPTLFRRMSTVSADYIPVITDSKSEVFVWGGGKNHPMKVDLMKKYSPLCVSMGTNHFAVLTIENELFTWASSQCTTEQRGQLGHGDKSSQRKPKRVSRLDNIPIIKVVCGEDITLCLTDEGELYVFGSNDDGCLGDNGESSEYLVPEIIDFFSGIHIVDVACGYNHVLALTKNGLNVYSWGAGEYGRLGHNSEDDCFLPQEIVLNSKIPICGLAAGIDTSFFITITGKVLACGSNDENKLGLNFQVKGKIGRSHSEYSSDVPCILKPKLVKPLNKYNIVKIATDARHSAAIDGFGKLITFGCNLQGQLGVGDNKPRLGINVVRGELLNKRVSHVSCGDNFTVAATTDNHIYSWGLPNEGRLGFESTPNHKRICFPRPIFGSLHVVSSISCRSWFSIIIAEQLISSKTLRTSSAGSRKSTTSSPSISRLSTPVTDSEFQTSFSETSVPIRKPSTELSESDCPACIQDILDGASYIPATPVDANDERVVSQHHVEMETTIIALQKENEKLKDLVSELQIQLAEKKS